MAKKSRTVKRLENKIRSLENDLTAARIGNKTLDELINIHFNKVNVACQRMRKVDEMLVRFVKKMEKKNAKK